MRHDGPDGVLARLERHAAFGTRLSQAGRHALFARLYYCTSRRWIEHAAHCTDPALVSFLVDHFFDLYVHHVTGIDTAEPARSGRHWQVYHRLTGRANHRPGSFADLFALLFGIRAHTRFDLAEAIRLAQAEHERQFGRAPDPAHFRALLFGRQSNRIFREAATDFVLSLVGMRHCPAPLRLILYLVSLLWLPVFQAARTLAWYDAQRQERAVPGLTPP